MSVKPKCAQLRYLTMLKAQKSLFCAWLQTEFVVCFNELCDSITVSAASLFNLSVFVCSFRQRLV